MAKDITLKTRNGETRYPKTVTAIVYENGTGKTLQTIITELRQVDSDTDNRTRMFKADVTNLDTLNKKTDIGLYNYVGNGWRGAVSINYDSADNVSQVALSSSTPSYNGNTLTWLSAQPCAMARTYQNGAWTHWEKVGASVVNDLMTGGTDKALSAEMGKTLKEGLDALGPELVNEENLFRNSEYSIPSGISALFYFPSALTVGKKYRITITTSNFESTDKWGYGTSVYLRDAGSNMQNIYEELEITGGALIGDSTYTCEITATVAATRIAIFCSSGYVVSSSKKFSITVDAISSVKEGLSEIGTSVRSIKDGIRKTGHFLVSNTLPVRSSGQVTIFNSNENYGKKVAIRVLSNASSGSNTIECGFTSNGNTQYVALSTSFTLYESDYDITRIYVYSNGVITTAGDIEIEIVYGELYNLYGVDTVPVAESTKLVTSDGIFKAISNVTAYIHKNGSVAARNGLQYIYRSQRNWGKKIAFRTLSSDYEGNATLQMAITANGATAYLYMTESVTLYESDYDITNVEVYVTGEVTAAGNVEFEIYSRCSYESYNNTKRTNQSLGTFVSNESSAAYATTGIALRTNGTTSDANSSWGITDYIEIQGDMEVSNLHSFYNAGYPYGIIYDADHNFLAYIPNDSTIGTEKSGTKTNIPFFSLPYNAKYVRFNGATSKGNVVVRQASIQSRLRSIEDAVFNNIDPVDLLVPVDDNNPLHVIKREPGFAAIFLNWGFIGDSLTSGEHNCYLNGSAAVYDAYDFSWGQFICRATGAQGYNFSQGGQTANGWINGSTERTWAGAQQNLKTSYIIALGTNDARYITDSYPVGDENDVNLADYTQNGNSFFGDYAGIIQRLRSVQPKAPIFCCTTYNGWGVSEHFTAINAAIRSVVGLFEHVYLIDINVYYPKLTTEWASRYSNTHFTAQGYLLIAWAIMTYIDWIVRHNWVAFKGQALVGTNYTIDA